MSNSPELNSSEQKAQFKQIAWQGLWKNNPGLVQLLGLCPLLAVSGTVINALGMGLATMAVLIGSNLTVSLVRKWVPDEIRIPIFVLIIAAFVTSVQLLMNAWAYELYQALGIFIPLIVTNCIIIGRAEAFASRNSPQLATLDGIMMGTGFLLVLVVLGAMRELLGQGTLFDGAELLLGPWAAGLRIEIFSFEHPLLLAILPPGAFFAMGLLIAARNLIEEQLKARQPAEKAAITRARVTAQ